jgi:hypothetical protein
MAKKAAAQNGRADLPVSQDARQRICNWHASHYAKVMLDQILAKIITRGTRTLGRVGTKTRKLENKQHGIHLNISRPIASK